MVSYEFSGDITGTQTVDTLVGAVVAFEGHQARETVTQSTGSNTVSGTTAFVTTNNKSYSNRTGDAEMTQYGLVTEASSSGGGFPHFSTTTRIVFSPPYVERVYALAIGESISALQSGTATNTNSQRWAAITTNISGTINTRYAGRESLTVPAGTYTTCKFEVTSDGSLTTNWVIVGKGITVQSTLAGQTVRARSVRLNGQAL